MKDLLGLKTKAAYYKKESGSVKFTLHEAKKISDFFKLSIEQIFFDSHVPNKNYNTII
nr:XRE family transcriptional regulator [Clostridium beijerinckii]